MLVSAENDTRIIFEMESVRNIYRHLKQLYNRCTLRTSSVVINIHYDSFPLWEKLFWNINAIIKCNE